MNTKKRRAHWIALLLGLTATGGVVTAYCTGRLDWLEYKTLDLRFIYANSVRERDDLVLIRIDDRSLQLRGRWPWSRSDQAALIAIPAELGAKKILVDLEWLEPDTDYFPVDPDADMLQDLENITPRGRLWGDRDLSRAISDAGNVYITFNYSVERPDNPDPDRELRRQAEDEKRRIGSQMQRDRDLLELPPHVLSRFLFDQLHPGKPIQNRSPERDLFVIALREWLGIEYTTRRSFSPAGLESAAQSIDRLTPVYPLLARSAARCGFSVFVGDEDGVARRLPLLAQYEQRVVPQLAFGLICDLLDVGPRDLRMENGRLVVGELRIQLDRSGQALVPWVSQRDVDRDTQRHVPATKIMEVHERRGYIRDNEDTIRQIESFQEEYERLSRIKPGELSPEDQERLKGLKGNRLEYKTIRAACARANEKLRGEVVEMLDELRQRIEGKICLIGYTATALADMTPIPGKKRAAGVYAHYSLLNGLLSGRVVSWASTPLNAFVAVVFGVLASVVSLSMGPRSVIVIVVLLVLAYVGWAAGVFYTWTYWIAITPTVGTIFVSYFAIAVYRYMFADRERRHLATALGQYTSREIARQVAENPELCRRAEVREVTSIFTDLKDFTTISERIGAERTQHVLNACLGRLTEIMLQYEALVNKFMGDGIFAFWNPVIYPQENHAGLACDTAIDLHVGLRKLIDEQRAAGGDPVFGQLVLRVGLASGKAVVGPCGSEQKFDYTCIGDSVNLASRLETANKYFGTSILVNGVTRDAAGDRFEFRPLGRVQVKGKQKDVPVYELLGRTGEVNGERLDHARRFGQAIAAFQERKWDEAQRIFEECSRARPDDPIAKHYSVTSAIHAHEDPGEDWNSAIELTEK